MDLMYIVYIVCINMHQVCAHQEWDMGGPINEVAVTRCSRGLFL